jgi:hypothetical protein
MRGRFAWRKAARRVSLAAAWLPALAACTLSPNPRNDRPDVTVGFATGWQAAADCSAQRLGNLYTTAKLTHHPDQGYAEIVVGIGPDTTSAGTAGMYSGTGISGASSTDAAGMYSGTGIAGASSTSQTDDGTIMIIDFRDIKPRQAQAKIYAARYMLLPGSATGRAAAAMASCRTGAAAAPSTRLVAR